MKRLMQVMVLLLLAALLLSCDLFHALQGRWNPFDADYERATDPENADGLVPVSVSHLRGEYITGAILLTWRDNSDTESGYKILRQEGAETTFTTITAKAANATTHTDTVTEGYKYTYQVVAFNSIGDGAESNTLVMYAIPGGAGSDPTVSVTTAESDPTNADPIPVEITFSEEVSGFEQGDITLGNATVDSFSTADDTVFSVGVAPAGQGEVQVSVPAAVALSALTARDNQASNTLSITFDSIPPGDVTGFDVVGDSATSLALSWTNPGGDFAGVHIRRKTGGYPSGPADGDAVYDGAATGTTDGSLTAGTEYSYRAFAYDDAGNFASGATDSHVATFGTIDLGAYGPLGAGIAYDANSAAVYVGGTESGADTSWRVEKRKTVDGSLDTSFSGDGIWDENPSSGVDYLMGLTRNDATDELWLSGMYYSDPYFKARAVSLENNGAYNTDFSTDGIWALTDNMNSAYQDIYYQGSSNVFLFGWDDDSGGDERWRTDRVGITGTLNNTIYANSDGAGMDQAFCGTYQLSVYTGGSDSSPGNDQIRIERRGTDGYYYDAYTYNPSTGDDEVRAMVSDADYVYAAGDVNNADGIIIKLDRDTDPLVTVGAFDVDGIVVTGSVKHFNDIILDGSYLFAAGWDGSQIVVEKRSKTTGALVGAFDGDGVLTLPGSNGAIGVATDDTYLYVFGLSGSNWVLYKRDKTTGEF